MEHPGPTIEPHVPGRRPGRPPGDRHERPNETKARREKKQRKSATVESIEALGTTEVPAAKSNIHVLTIIGQIEGHLTLPPQNKTTRYEHIIPQLVAAELNQEIEGVLVILNTVGGDVEAGLALAEMMATISKPSVSLVLGGGHSIGVPIAVAADYSYITHTATMTIHPIRLSGLVIGVPQTYEYLDKMQDRVVKFVVANSRITEAKYRELMFRTGELARDIGTVLVGKDAVKVGLIDDVGGISEAVAKVQELIRHRRGRRTRPHGNVPPPLPPMPPPLHGPTGVEPTPPMPPGGPI